MTEQAHVSGAIPPLTLGWRIQMALDHGGLKHGDLVEKFEISRGTASRWCRDAGAPPKKFVLNEIAVMCGVSPRWLIDGKDDSQPDPEPPRGIEPLTYSVSMTCATTDYIGLSSATCKCRSSSGYSV